MSLKDLFNQEISSKILANKSLENVGSIVESADYVKRSVEQKNLFVPQVDYSDPANFAFWGSAENYYNDAIDYILNSYPYDGSLKEKIEWELSGTFVDKWVFENHYPRVNGYAKLGETYGTINGSLSNNYGSYGNDNYIQFRGGPHTASVGMIGQKMINVFAQSNFYDTTRNRENNLDINGDNGVTVEFWLKKGSFLSSSVESPKQVILDVWNNVAYGQLNYGRFRIEIQSGSAQFHVELASGTAGWSSGSISSTIGSSLMFTGSVWAHYALTFINSGSVMIGRLFQNGELNDTISAGSSIDHITGSMIGNLGGLITTVSGAFGGTGYGKLSGSVDEFRFWKVKRTAEKIGQFWFSQVGAGTNSDPANTDLGVYFKFNEGILSSGSSVVYEDKVVLDFSGRVSNGFWVGFVTGSRTTGSAMVEADFVSSEFADPILKEEHNDIVDLRHSFQEIGAAHDNSNNAAIINNIPTWITADDEKKGVGVLSKLSQVLGSYFDNLHLQIKSIPSLRYTNYISSSYKPFPFVNRFLEAQGLITPEIFSEAEIIEALANRDDFQEFDENFDQLRNRIYQNIYNNLSFIYKSKGTEKSFRNLLHCFGIGEDLIRLNLYADNVEFEINDNFKSEVAWKKYVDFNDVDRFVCTVYQTSSDANTRSFITGTYSNIFYPNTYECEAIFPKKFEKDSSLYFPTSFLTSSIFGCHQVGISSPNDLTWASADIANFQVQAIRTALESKDVYFRLITSTGGVITEMTSSVFTNVYDGNKWNFAVKIKPTTGIFANSLSGSSPTFNVEFVGIQNVLDVVENQFSLSSTLSQTDGANFLRASKRFFVGAHRTNFTGTVLEKTDLKISNLRVWMKELTNKEIEFHARNSLNFGTMNPSRNAYLVQHSASLSGSGLEPLEPETLALHWTFDNVSSSGPSSDGLSTTADATFVVEDLSSGSLSLISRHSWLGDIVHYRHIGKGNFFLPNETNVVQKEPVQIAKTQNFEVLNSDDLVQIKNQDVELFKKSSRPIKFFYALEKSMNSVVSDEILKIFASLKDFNNLIGSPINRYRQNYKDLERLCRRFFENIQNEPDVEKFVDYFKWIDNSVSQILRQLIPATANFSDKVKTVIEGHILERNKYWNKIPTLEFRAGVLETGFRGVNELLYDWEQGHRPISNSEAENALYWKQRAERNYPPLRSTDTNVDFSRGMILSASLSSFNRSLSSPLRLSSTNDPIPEGLITGTVLRNLKHSHASSTISSSVKDASGNPAHIPLGNYALDYEVIQANNPRTFVKSLGFPRSTLTSSNITGVVDFQLPTIDQNKFNFRCIFSAPGDPDVCSRGSRDLLTEEFAVNNNLNFRNRSVREPLDLFEKIHTAQFGYNSDQSTTPNYHKIHRNTQYRVELSGSSFITSSVHDNKFVMHDIPRSSLQYLWISSSLQETSLGGNEQTFGFENNKITVPSSGGFSIESPGLVLTSGSDVMSSVSSAGRVLGYDKKDPVGIANGQRLFTDFVGLNHHIYEPVSSSENLLGYSSLTLASSSEGVSGSNYLNSSFVTGAVFTPSYPGAAGIVNAILLHRNGPYNYPTWKQIRTNDHPVVRVHRISNIISVIDPPRVYSVKDTSGRLIFYKDKRADRFTNYKEPSVSWRHQPLIHSFVVSGVVEPIVLEYEHGNLLETFANAELANKLLANVCRPQVYDKLKKLYLNVQGTSPIQGFVSLLYRENVYPKSLNVGFERTRGRINYFETSSVRTATSGNFSNDHIAVADYSDFGIDRGPLERLSFWRDDYRQRNREGIIDEFSNLTGRALIVNTTALNSQNYLDARGSSIFGLGINLNHTGTLSSGSDYYAFFEHRNEDFGELNRNVLVADTGTGHFTCINWSMFSTASVDKYPDAGYYFFYYPTASALLYYNSFITALANTTQPPVHPNRFCQMVPRYRTNVFAGKNSWFDTYSDFAKDVRVIGKNYSQLPEFKISDHLDFYINQKGGNFRTMNNAFLEMKGGCITSSAQSATSSFNEDFFKIFSHTEIMKFLGSFEEDHNGDTGLTKIKMVCRGIKKLLPYNGFYPQQRTLQLASIFSQSVGPFIGGIKWNTGTTSFSNSGHSGTIALQSLLQPLFAPGILFNTIKAGIAVDWACYTSSNPHYRTPGGCVFLTGSNYRLPFETLIDLQGGAGKGGLPLSSSDGSKTVFYLGPEVYNYLDRIRTPYFDWNGQKSPLFEMVMHNFLAEIPNFFLKDGSLTKFSSLQQNQVLGKFRNGTTYYMDVVLYKSKNFTMMESYFNNERKISWGGVDRVSYDGRFFGPSVSPYSTALVNVSNTHFLCGGMDPSEAPYTPPYFYGKSIARLIYTADGNEQNSSISSILSNIVVQELNDELQQSIQFYNNETGTTNVLGNATDSPAWISRMPMSASLNLFEIQREKKIEYNTLSQKNGQFLPISAIDPDNSDFDKWVIQTKFETPVLNFRNQPFETYSVSSSYNLSFENPYMFTLARGMWSGYGAIPTGSEGIFLGIVDSFPDQLKGSQTNIGSLIDVFGFDTTPQKIGQISHNKKISEAIVAIPFVDTKIDKESEFAETEKIAGRNFFKIGRKLFNFQKEQVKKNLPAIPAGSEFGNSEDIQETSISRLSLILDDYIIPPEYNFGIYEDIEPFVMYIFEFSHILDQQDLSDIWQGVMPKISMIAEKEEVVIEHKINHWEFFGNKKLPKDVRWMVFKVKKKANNNYYKLTANNKDDDRFKFSFKTGQKTPEYTANWPYDFFSLVELAQIEAGVEFGPIDNKQPIINFPRLQFDLNQ